MTGGRPSHGRRERECNIRLAVAAEVCRIVDDRGDNSCCLVLTQGQSVSNEVPASLRSSSSCLSCVLYYVPVRCYIPEPDISALVLPPLRSDSGLARFSSSCSESHTVSR